LFARVLFGCSASDRADSLEVARAAHAAARGAGGGSRKTRGGGGGDDDDDDGMKALVVLSYALRSWCGGKHGDAACAAASAHRFGRGSFEPVADAFDALLERRREGRKEVGGGSRSAAAASATLARHRPAALAASAAAASMLAPSPSRRRASSALRGLLSPKRKSRASAPLRGAVTSPAANEPESVDDDDDARAGFFNDVCVSLCVAAEWGSRTWDVTLTSLAVAAARADVSRARGAAAAALLVAWLDARAKIDGDDAWEKDALARAAAALSGSTASPGIALACAALASYASIAWRGQTPELVVDAVIFGGGGGGEEEEEEEEDGDGGGDDGGDADEDADAAGFLDASDGASPPLARWMRTGGARDDVAGVSIERATQMRRWAGDWMLESTTAAAAVAAEAALDGDDGDDSRFGSDAEDEDDFDDEFGALEDPFVEFFDAPRPSKVDAALGALSFARGSGGGLSRGPASPFAAAKGAASAVASASRWRAKTRAHVEPLAGASPATPRELRRKSRLRELASGGGGGGRTPPPEEEEVAAEEDDDAYDTGRESELDGAEPRNPNSNSNPNPNPFATTSKTPVTGKKDASSSSPLGSLPPMPNATAKSPSRSRTPSPRRSTSKSPRPSPHVRKWLEEEAKRHGYRGPPASDGALPSTPPMSPEFDDDDADEDEGRENEPPPTATPPRSERSSVRNEAAYRKAREALLSSPRRRGRASRPTTPTSSQL
jgi:hypothetical protein